MCILYTMKNKIQSTKENNKILSDVIAIRIKEKLEEKRNFALNLVESAQGSIL